MSAVDTSKVRGTCHRVCRDYVVHGTGQPCSPCEELLFMAEEIDALRAKLRTDEAVLAEREERGRRRGYREAFEDLELTREIRGVRRPHAYAAWPEADRDECEFDYVDSTGRVRSCALSRADSIHAVANEPKADER